METFSALLALCVGDSLVTSEFPAQRPVTWSFDVFLDLCLNKQLSKLSKHRWFETLSCSLWRHRNEYVYTISLTTKHSTELFQTLSMHSLSQHSCTTKHSLMIPTSSNNCHFIQYNMLRFNSLRPSDTYKMDHTVNWIISYYFRYSLVVCSVPNHYLNKCRLFVNWNFVNNYHAVKFGSKYRNFHAFCNLKLPSAKCQPFCLMFISYFAYKWLYNATHYLFGT